MDDTKTPFDKRIDQIGLANELVKLYADPLKDALKEKFGKNQTQRAEGDLFDAILVESESRSIDPEHLLKLFEKKKIDRGQLLSALKVKVDACEEFLSREQVDGIAEKTKTTALRITRKKGVAVALLDCVRGICDAVMPGQRQAA